MKNEKKKNAKRSNFRASGKKSAVPRKINILQTYQEILFAKTNHIFCKVLYDVITHY